jgi:hypothetical protein
VAPNPVPFPDGILLDNLFWIIRQFTKEIAESIEQAPAAAPSKDLSINEKYAVMDHDVHVVGIVRLARANARRRSRRGVTIDLDLERARRRWNGNWW